jgi:integrase/recombinase XerD
MAPQTVNYKIVRPAAEEAGIQEVVYTDKNGGQRYRITAHALRHGHGVHALKSGIDVRTVQKHLDHAKLEMTMRYLQLIDSDVKEGYRRFGVEQASA